MKTLWLLLLISFLVACGGPGTTCDASNCAGCCSASGVCQAGTAPNACGANGGFCDTCLTGQQCSAGRCSATGTGGGGGSNSCTSSAGCSNTTDVCYQGACSSGFGRAYRVTFVAATAPSNDNGSAWDFGGGAPDLKACLTLDGAFVGCTSEQGDVFTASWSETLQVTVTANSRVAVSLYDVDVSVDDLVESFEWPNGSSFLGAVRQGGLKGRAFNGALVTWDLAITPL